MPVPLSEQMHDLSPNQLPLTSSSQDPICHYDPENCGTRSAMQQDQHGLVL